MSVYPNPLRLSLWLLPFLPLGLVVFNSEWLAASIAVSCALALLLVELCRDRKADPFHAFCALLVQGLLVGGLLLACKRAYFNYFNLTDETSDKAQAAAKAFASVWWLAGGLFFCSMINRLFLVPVEVKTQRMIPAAVRRFLGGLVLIAAGCGALSFVYGLNLTGMLATSGLVAMIVGLAVQKNIADLFSGIVLFLDRPFRVGDWIQIRSSSECMGKVLDMTWRTTRLLTPDRSVLCIPNSVAAECVVCNYAYPEEMCREKLVIRISPAHSPDEVEKLLLDAAIHSTGVLSDPKPDGRFGGVNNGLAEYELLYCYSEFANRKKVLRAVWRNLWWHLTYAGINLDTRPLDIVVERRGREQTGLNGEFEALRKVEVFRPFPDEVVGGLTKSLRRHHFDPSDTIVEQGQAGSSMFVILEGCVGVTVTDKSGTAHDVARLGVPEVFGEMALLTGEARMATVRALTRTVVLEITKDDIKPLFDQQPEAMQQVAEIVAIRRAATEARLSEGLGIGAKKAQLTDRIFHTIMGFFGWKGARND
jgi:branched-chain amino acid transport system substrate-binding protein